MSSPFSIFPSKHKASKPIRFRQDKIKERREKPHFIKVHPNKAKTDLEATGFLTGTFEAVVENILKQKNLNPNSPDRHMYYNVTLMFAGHKAEFDKFLHDNVPKDTFIPANDRDPYIYIGDIPNFNEKWLTLDHTRMLTVDEALQAFSGLSSVMGENYESTVRYYHEQFTLYFDEARVRHQAAKESKEKNEMSFESLGDSLGPFKYPLAGTALLKYIKNNMGEVKKKSSGKAADNTFDKYFITEPNTVIRVSLTTSSKTGNTSLTTKKEAESSIIGSTRSKAFKPFPNMAPQLYFNNENIYDAFMRELKNNIVKVANTLTNPHFKDIADIYVLETDSEIERNRKAEQFLFYLESDYAQVRQNKLLNNANRQFQPLANVPVSTTLRA